MFVVMALGLTGCGGGGDSGSSTGSNTAAKAADFTGTWTGAYNGTNFSYNVTQSENNITIVRTTPLATGITYSGTGSGDTAVINTYGNGTYMGYTTWSKTASNTMSVYLNSCIPISGFSCGASNGVTLNLTKQ